MKQKFVTPLPPSQTSREKENEPAKMRMLSRPLARGFRQLVTKKTQKTDCHRPYANGEICVERLGSEFTPSTGWLARWKNQMGIKFKPAHGGKSSADEAAAENWLMHKLPKLLEEFPETAIFNADETRLFYRATPDSLTPLTPPRPPPPPSPRLNVYVGSAYMSGQTAGQTPVIYPDSTVLPKYAIEMCQIMKSGQLFAVYNLSDNWLTVYARRLLDPNDAEGINKYILSYICAILSQENNVRVISTMFANCAQSTIVKRAITSMPMAI